MSGSDASFEAAEFQSNVRFGKARSEEDVRFNTTMFRDFTSLYGASLQNEL